MSDTLHEMQAKNLQSYIDDNQERRKFDRRLMRLPVTLHLLIEFWKGTEARTLQVVGNPLPEDTRIIRADYDKYHDRIDLLIHSAAFESVGENENIPIYPPIGVKDWTGRVRLEPIE